MNPLATEFAPSTSPETRVSQLATRSSQPLAGESRHASRAAARSPVYHSRQAPIGSALAGGPFPPPHLAHPHHLALAQDGTSLFPDGSWLQDAHTDPWNQRPPPINHLDWQEAARCFPELYQGFDFEVPHDAPIPTAESVESNTRPYPYPIGLTLRPTSMVGEADSSNSYMTESLAHSHSTVTQRTPAVRPYDFCKEHLGRLETHEHLLPYSQEADGSAAQMGAVPSVLRRGCTLVGQFQAPSSVNRQALVASRPQQMLGPETSVPLHLSLNAYNIVGAQRLPSALDLGDQNWPPLQPPPGGACSNLKSRSQRGQSTRRAPRSGRTTSQRQQENADSRNILQLGDGYDGGVPVAAPLTKNSEAASGGPQHSPLQLSCVAWLNRENAVLADVSVRRQRSLLTWKEVGDHRDPCPPSEQNQRDAIRRRLRDLDTLAAKNNLENTDDGLLSRPAPGRDVELDMMQEMVNRHCISSPGLLNVVRPHDVLPANGHSLGRMSSQCIDARVSLSEAATPREFERASGIEARSSRTQGAMEPGSWTNSKRWMSEEMKERQAFSKMMINLRHIGAERSPCIPQSMTELAAFKAETAEENRKQLTRVVRRRIADFEHKKDLLQAGSEQCGARIDKLLWGRRFQDGASPVFAMNNCFSDDVAGRNDARVDWPSLAELKEEGEKRGGRHRRCLPLPRLNAIDPRLLVAGGNVDPFHPDGTIRWQVKAVSSNRAFIMPVSPPELKTAGEDAAIMAGEDGNFI